MWAELIALVLGGQLPYSGQFVLNGDTFSSPLSCGSGEDSTLLSAAFGLDKELLIFMGVSNGFLNSRLLRE